MKTVIMKNPGISEQDWTWCKRWNCGSEVGLTLSHGTGLRNLVLLDTAEFYCIHPSIRPPIHSFLVSIHLVF